MALAAATLVAATGPAVADEVFVSAGQSVQAAIEAAAPNAVVRLGSGLHEGPLVIDKPLSLVGEADARLEGPGTGSVITVNVSDVRIEGLEITGSGIDLPAMDSAVLVKRTAERASFATTA
jgi:nitrous oxidase accessory protein